MQRLQLSRRYPPNQSIEKWQTASLPGMRQKPDPLSKRQKAKGATGVIVEDSLSERVLQKEQAGRPPAEAWRCCSSMRRVEQGDRACLEVEDKSTKNESPKVSEGCSSELKTPTRQGKFLHLPRFDNLWPKELQFIGAKATSPR